MEFYSVNLQEALAKAETQIEKLEEELDGERRECCNLRVEMRELYKVAGGNLFGYSTGKYVLLTFGFNSEESVKASTE